MSAVGIKENNFKYFETVIILNYVNQQDKDIRKVSKLLWNNRIDSIYVYITEEVNNNVQCSITLNEYKETCYTFLKEYLVKEDDEYFYFDNIGIDYKPNVDKRYVNIIENLMLYEQADANFVTDKEFYKENLMYIEKDNWFALTSVKQTFASNYVTNVVVPLTNDFSKGSYVFPEYMTLNLYKGKM